jgi:hypothetical protein
MCTFPPSGMPPPTPGPPAPQHTWWRSRTAAAAVVAAIAGAGAGAVVGVTAGRKTTTTTVVSNNTVATTVTETQTETQVVRKPARTVTVNPASSAGPSGGGRTYSGNGDKNFGTIDVPVDSTLKWTCQCDPTNGFYLSSDINDQGNDISIQQNGSSGESAVSAGTYRNVHSIGNGTFTFRIVPGNP